MFGLGYGTVGGPGWRTPYLSDVPWMATTTPCGATASRLTAAIPLVVCVVETVFFARLRVSDPQSREPEGDKGASS